jgi:hypothetical protein
MDIAMGRNTSLMTWMSVGRRDCSVFVAAAAGISEIVSMQA